MRIFSFFSFVNKMLPLHELFSVDTQNDRKYYMILINRSHNMTWQCPRLNHNSMPKDYKETTVEALKKAVQWNEKYSSIKREETFKVLESSLHQEIHMLIQNLLKRIT